MVQRFNGRLHYNTPKLLKEKTMKTKIYKISGIFLLLLTIMLSCETEETINITQPDATFQLQEPAINALFLNFGLENNPAITISWNDEVTGSTSYDVEMSLSEDFSTTTTALGSTTTNSFSISVADLNDAILAYNPTNLNGLEIYMRVDASGTLSNTILFVVTAFPEEGPSFTTPEQNESFVLSIENEDDVALTTTWDDQGYNEVGNTQYTVELALSGTDFAEPQFLGTVSTNSFSIIHSALNTILFSNMGLEAEVAHDIDLRITAVSTIGDNVDSSIERVSELTTISITPYPFFPYLYLVGDATTPGWNNNNNNTAVFRSQDTPNSYYFTGYFNAGEFKILEELGEWQPQWGTNDGATLGVNPGEGSDPGTFNVATAGYYTFTATSLQEGEAYTFTSFDASSATTYTSMGLIGSATPNSWDGDTNFTQDPNNPHLWYINGVTLTSGGEFLFRANGNWDDAIWRYTGSEELYGQASFDGSNFPFNGITGNYDIWFNDLDGSYVIIPN